MKFGVEFVVVYVIGRGGDTEIERYRECKRGSERERMRDEEKERGGERVPGGSHDGAWGQSSRGVYDSVGSPRILSHAIYK